MFMLLPKSHLSHMRAFRGISLPLPPEAVAQGSTAPDAVTPFLD